MRRARLVQGVRFGLVGAGGYVVNMSVSAFALDALGLHYLVAATLAFWAALTHNFVLNRIWTFGMRDAAIPEQALRFTLVALASLALGLALLEGLVTLGLDELASQAISVALVAPVNFALNRTWTFSAELEALR